MSKSTVSWFFLTHRVNDWTLQKSVLVPKILCQWVLLYLFTTLIVVILLLIIFGSETRFIEVVEHACDESSKEVCSYFWNFIG